VDTHNFLMEAYQPMWKTYDKKFDLLWDQYQNGYKPPIYNPEQAAGRNGRRNSLTLSIHIDQPEIIKKIQAVTASIGDISGVYKMPSDSYHITVKWLGFLADQKQHNYDLEPQTLEQILEQTDQILCGIPQFSLRLGGINGLASFIILEVEDNGTIAQIQGRFHEEATSVPNYDLEGEQWLPHLSIAALNHLDGLKQLKTRMRELRDIEIGEIPVNHIDLIQASLQKPCPTYRTLKSFPLARRTLIPPPATPLRSQIPLQP
jgi:2'-5' RNA ligase